MSFPGIPYTTKLAYSHPPPSPLPEYTLKMQPLLGSLTRLQEIGLWFDRRVLYDSVWQADCTNSLFVQYW